MHFCLAADSRALDAETREFLKGAMGNLHVEYIFDSNGSFCPLRDVVLVRSPTVDNTTRKFDDFTHRTPFAVPAGLVSGTARITTWHKLAQVLEPDSLANNRYIAALEMIRTIMDAPLWFDGLVHFFNKERVVIKAIDAAGSHAKDTGLRGKKDLDVIIKVANFEFSRKKKYLDHIEDALRRKKINMTNAQLTSKHFKFETEGISVDVIVTGDPIELHQPWPHCLTNMHDTDRECWRAAFHIKQVEFMNAVCQRQPFVLRIVVRFAKFWRDWLVNRWADHSRPSSFLLELLVCHSLDSEQEVCMSLEQGSAIFLRCVVDYQQLNVTWPSWFPSDVAVPPKLRTEKGVSVCA